MKQKKTAHLRVTELVEEVFENVDRRHVIPFGPHQSRLLQAELSLENALAGVRVRLQQAAVRVLVVASSADGIS